MQFFIGRIFVISMLLMQPLMGADQTITVIDDEGSPVSLDQPARRIISLSPAITEMIFAAGGGEYIQGVVSYTNYPKGAHRLPEVGSYNALDLEKILALKPDLIVAWKSGNPVLQISKLKKLGLPVYLSEPVEISDIPSTMQKLGLLMGIEESADAAAKAFNLRFARLKSSYPPVQQPYRVFIQIWDKPLMSVSGKSLISKVIKLCGGENIFEDFSGLTLNPDIETILQHDPQVIITTGVPVSTQQWLTRWKQWDSLDAVRKQRLYSVNPDLLVRHTPRLLDGIEMVCSYLHENKQPQALPTDPEK